MPATFVSRNSIINNIKDSLPGRKEDLIFIIQRESFVWLYRKSDFNNIWIVAKLIFCLGLLDKAHWPTCTHIAWWTWGIKSSHSPPPEINQLLPMLTLSERFHTRTKCEIRMIILVIDHANAGILVRVYAKLASQRIILIVQFKWWSAGVFSVIHLSNDAAKSPRECLDL